MTDNTLYLYTSLTAGSSHIVTATARLETILKANKLPFRAIDVATDDASRKLWGRRSRGRKLPGLVKAGMIVGDLEQIEEWNEYGELRMQVNNVEALDSFPADTPASLTGSSATTPSATDPNAPPKQSTIKIQSPPSKEHTKDDSITVAMRQASEEAALKAKDNKSGAGPTDTTTAATAPTSNATAAPAAGTGEKKTPGEETVRRKSIIGEIAGEIQRPRLVPENAAVSSANLHADNPAALREHHRGSIVSATSKEERDQVAQDLRKSMSGGRQDMLDALRQDHKGDNGEQRPTFETIEQDPFED
ncbi:uncharacterized protein ASPGLDRAFT_1449686 [Aspergillus glaucus CBS 516.65]|uniref:Uncharacterized protein n=1 Tax=Aspergillus glaucus CBS 516.65 TaxID=1160497 RepID=A0A1L9VKV4_ASPGL|nr:hypothetical protein ASPGLDRAFT_1449686 [Aspergillus glaucus CBS 516.65]OJJ84521.1 hypothetical protein ASPGLDRAFT_1449686 [Aspergillus glaucus CBS 516.65]